ncbi:MAG TPA: hypothetical protein VN512_07680 [Clostridia bacterium]|nr:hypothetical protein [Clostridia bacterium]
MIGALALFQVIRKAKTTYITGAALISSAVLCALLPNRVPEIPGLSFLLSFNMQFSHFLIQYPLMLLFALPLFSVVQNDMLRVRHMTQDKVFQTEAVTALVLSALYALQRIVIERGFYLAMGGKWDVAIFAVELSLILMTTYMTLLLYLAIKALLHKSVWSVLVLTTLLAVDAMTALLHFPLLPESLFLFTRPLNFVVIMATEGMAESLFWCSLSLTKVMASLLLLWLAKGRAEYYV